MAQSAGGVAGRLHLLLVFGFFPVLELVDALKEFEESRS